jgi:hypothetical protein
MVLLDRSKLRLKAATAKLKKQAQCNMSRRKAQMEGQEQSKGAVLLPPAASPSCGTIAANV